MICLLAGAVAVSLMSDRLTLRWRHSVEKTVWEEDWAEVPGGLKLVASRVQGSGAGMDPAPDSRFANGFWSWTPRLPVLHETTLRRSGATADYRVCIAGRCRAMGDYVGPKVDPVTMTVCPARSVAPPRQVRAR